MKNKKVTAILTILFLSLSLCGCSDKINVSQESSSEFFDTSEETEEETETTKASESTEEEETETTKESENKTEESKEETKETKAKESKTSTSESSKQSTPKQEETKQAETTPTPHTHNYSSSVIVSPTCNTNGVEKFTCTSCGESYEQSIPATGQHTFEPKYETIEYPQIEEWQQIQVGTSGDVYICCYCGAEFSSHSDITNHWLSYDDLDHAGSNYLIRDGGPIYESKLIVIQEARTENVIVSYTCTTCGISQK